MSRMNEQPASEIDALRDLIEWYRDVGAEFSVDDEPHDRFAESAAEMLERGQLVARKQEKKFSEPLSTRPVPSSPEGAQMSARAQAIAAETLEQLRQTMEQFDGCALKHSASKLVFADGNPDARIMLVGEAPGRDEDEQGKPFVGKSGQLLDRMLAAIGLDRDTVYIANIVPWRPPGNRTPTPQEISICLPFILRQIELAAPDVLVCLGGPSAHTLLNQQDGILRLRGRWFDFSAGGKTIPALATLHPAYLLRQPAQKRLAWRDLRALQSRLK